MRPKGIIAGLTGIAMGLCAVTSSADAQALTACIAKNGAVAVVSNRPCPKRDSTEPVLSPQNGWSLTGNTGTNAGPDFLGTTDNQPFELHVNGTRVMRYEPTTTNASDDIGANVIGGDAGNSISGGSVGATIAGGGGSDTNGDVFPNAIQADDYGAVCGGGGNTVGSANGGGFFDTVAGGLYNTALGGEATVAGGQDNTASGSFSTVAGGDFNTASGIEATVLGGSSNVASGTASLAAGSRANALHPGAWVWSDASSGAPFTSQTNNQFSVRATSARFITSVDSSGNSLAGVFLSQGSSAWGSISDRNAKANFKHVDVEALVERLAAIPVETWNYKTQDPSIRHMGPMAQDFHAAFEIGEDDKHITTIDSEGVALAAIQGLYIMIKERDEELRQLRSDLKAQQARLDGFEHRNDLIQAKTSATVPFGSAD